MVNLTSAVMRKAVYYDKYWRKRQVLKMSAHFYGRGRNCFTIAVKRVNKALQYVTRGRILKKIWSKELWEKRIESGCEELEYIPQGPNQILESLARSDIALNRQSISNLAIWEPRSFKALNKVAYVKAHQEKLGKLGPAPSGIFTRGML